VQFINIIIIIILYSHRTVTDGLTPWAGVAITEELVGGEKDGICMSVSVRVRCEKRENWPHEKKMYV
jgi:hypothetical protein